MQPAASGANNASESAGVGQIPIVVAPPPVKVALSSNNNNSSNQMMKPPEAPSKHPPTPQHHQLHFEESKQTINRLASEQTKAVKQPIMTASF